MRYIKLGNTMFLADSIVGVAKNEAPSDFGGQYRFRVTVYLTNEALKAITYPCKTAKDADAVVSALLDNSKVIDIEEVVGISGPSDEELMKDTQSGGMPGRPPGM